MVTIADRGQQVELLLSCGVAQHVILEGQGRDDPHGMRKEPEEHQRARRVSASALAKTLVNVSRRPSGVAAR